MFYDDTSIWELIDDETDALNGWFVADKALGTNTERKKRQVGFPSEGSNVMIKQGTWLVLRNGGETQWGEIAIHGVLELDSGATEPYKLSATHIIILVIYCQY